MLRTDLWHGGAPGRKPGDLLLPPTETGLLCTNGVLSAEAGLAEISYRTDRVYLASSRELARVWAGQWTNPEGRVGYGWLYRVSVETAVLEPDDDLQSLPGVSYQAVSARVESIYEKAVAPDQPAFRRALEQSLRDHAAAKNRAMQQP